MTYFTDPLVGLAHFAEAHDRNFCQTKKGFAEITPQPLFASRIISLYVSWTEGKNILSAKCVISIYNSPCSNWKECSMLFSIIKHCNPNFSLALEKNQLAVERSAFFDNAGTSDQIGNYTDSIAEFGHKCAEMCDLIQLGISAKKAYLTICHHWYGRA